MSICQFVLPTKQRTLKFLKFCGPVSWLLQTNNFRIRKFNHYCSFQWSWWIFHNFSPCQKKQKKNPRKGLLQGHQNAKLHKHKPSLMLIVSYNVTYFFSIYYCSSCEVWHLTQSCVPLKQLLEWISVNSVLESTMCSKLQM